MSKKASPVLIGIFTLVGLIITAVALVLIGVGKAFQQSDTIMLYFDKSANGLQVGSDVRFGGVRIGRVTSISVLIDPKVETKIIPVLVELGEKELKLIGSTNGNGIDFGTREGVKKAVEDGLRAGMKQQSLLTGQLYIEFDIVPEEPGFVYIPEADAGYPTVPTIGTEIDELIAGVADGLKKINSLDLDGVVKELRDVLVNANTQLKALDIKSINDNVLDITKDVKNITGNEKLASAVDKLDSALIQIDELATKANAGIDPVLADLDIMMEKANAGLAKIDEAAREIEDISNPRAPVLMRLQNVLQETERASRAIKELSNDLKRSPNAILSGKETPE